ncbi:hypothetical protein ACO0QE_001947 [Hanseniaspora vineae]
MYNKIVKTAPVLINAHNAALLTKIPTWLVISNEKTEYHKLTKTFNLKNFEATWAFLTQVAMRSHLFGHHPTITTTFTNVKIELNTHDMGNAITDIDIKLATKIDSYEKIYT